MASFRIKVDLSDFFDDCRKESYIFVKQEWAAIKAIQSHLVRLFSLVRTPLLITGDGIYLPPEESIQILSPTDTIKVCRNSSVPVTEVVAPRPKFNNRSNSTLLDHCNLPALFSTNETPIVPPAEILKKRSSIGAAQLKKSKLSINFDNTLLDKTQPSEEDEEDEEDETSTPKNLSQKKARKRVRKRKAKLANGGSQSTPLIENGNESQKRKVIEKQTSKENGAANNKHTKFASGSSSESSSEEEAPVVAPAAPKSLNSSVKFRSQDIPKVSRIIKGIRASCPVAGEPLAKQMAVDIDDSCALVASDEDDEPVEVLEPENASLDFNKTADLDALRKNLASYPAVESLPNKNDFIGFRVLKMAENYVPVLSEYIIGLVDSVDSDTMAMEIVILAGNEELKQHQEGGKFSLPDCNDALVNIDDRTLHCNWIELKDVRLVDVSQLA